MFTSHSHVTFLSFIPAFLILTSPLQAADSSLDNDFVTTISPGLTPTSYPTFDSGTAAVNATALQSDGKILAGGNVSRYQTAGPLSALKRVLPTGALDTTFNPGGGAGLATTTGQPEVNALVTDDADLIYVGGTFDSYNGIARSGILRLFADGSLDPNYATIGLSGGAKLALDLCLQPDGKLLVGGGFTSANGTFRRNLARFEANGTLDTTFDANATLNTSATIQAIALQPDGKILVGGNFNLGNFNTGQLLLRLNSDGSLDSSFSAPLNLTTGVVQELLVLPDGRIVASGFLTLSQPAVDTFIAAFLPNGDLDATFFQNLGTGPNGWTGGDLLLQPDGTILTSGIYNLWNGQPRASIVRLQPDGTLDPDLAVPPYEANRNNYLTHFYSLSVQPDGKIVAGGWFSRVTSPITETYNLTRFINEFAPASAGKLRLLAATANVAENESSITFQVSRFGGLSGAVSAQFGTSPGTATAGSDYTSTTGTLSWADGEGGVKSFTVPILQDTLAEDAETFTATLTNPTGGATIPVSNAQTIVTIRDDDSAPVIITQPVSVATTQGSRVSFSVRFDSVLSATVQWQYDADGLGVGADFADIPGATSLTYTIPLADPTLHNGHYRAVVTSTVGATFSNAAELFVSVPAGSVVTTFVPPSLTETINASALDSAGRYVIGSQLGLRRYTTAGTTDSTFTPSSFNNAVSAVYVLPDGRILAGGFFANVTNSGSTVTRPALARFSSTGVLETSYAPSLPSVSGSIYTQTFASGAGGKYYVGFGTGGGLRRYFDDGSHDTSFTANVGGNIQGVVFAVRERADGRILVAQQNGANGQGFTYTFVLLEANGSPSSTSLFTPVTFTGGSARDFDLLPDGRIIIGGQFTTVNGIPRSRLVLLNADGTLDDSFLLAPLDVPNNTVQRVLYRDGRIVVTGPFTRIGNQDLSGLARLNLDGSLDSTFSIGSGANGPVLTALYNNQGNLFIGGSFTSINNISRSRAALLEGLPLIGAIGFAPPRVSAIETNGTLSLTLRRYGPTTEAASITWSTADGTATAGTDFTAASGTVTWASGDSADKIIDVSLLSDSTIESTEIFRVLLGIPTGPVTAAASATISLLDSDTPVTISTQPTAPASALTAGGTLTLTTATASPTPTSYQWFLNGTAIPGATNPTLTRTPLTLADAGLYTLVATNASGPTTSTPALVVITRQGGVPVPGQPTTGRPAFGTNTVRSLLALPDGGALIGGSFSLDIASNRLKANLLRVRPDGTTDPSFPLTFNNVVSALVAQPDGKILVFGNSSIVGGIGQRYLVRLNADLTLDTAYNSAVTSALSTSVVPNGTSALKLAIDSTGRAYLSFSSTSNFIRRLNPDGTLDSSYLVGFSGGSPSGLTIDASDRLLVGGSFTNIGPVASLASNFPSTSPARARLARLATDGTVDATFTPNASTYTVGDIIVLPGDGRIFAATTASPGLIEVLADGSATVTPIDNSSNVTGIGLSPNGRITMVRNVATGTAVRRFVPAATVGAGATVEPGLNLGTGPNVGLNALAHLPDGSFWVTGAFTSFNGEALAGVARIQPPAGDPEIVNPPLRTDANPGTTVRLSVGAVGTGLTYQWSKNGSPLADDIRVSGTATPILTITDLALADDASYTVTVTGSAAPTAPITSSPVKINVLGAPLVVTSPASVAPVFGSTVTLTSDVLALTPATYTWTRDGVVIQNGGRYSGATTGKLIIQGANNSDDGSYTLTVANSLGTTATSPAALAVSQVPHALDSTLSALSVSTPGSTTNVVNAILHLPDGRTLLGGSGSFVGTGPTSAASALVVISATGQVTVPPTGIFNSDVLAVHRQADGKILVAGTFTSIGGTTGIGRTRIARLNADLSLDTSFLAVGASNTVSGVASDSLGRIYLYGSFGNYDGQSGYTSFVRLLPTGALDLSFKPTLGSISALRVQSDDKVIIGGSVNSYTFDGVVTPDLNGLVRLLPDGSVDTAFAYTLPSNTSIQALDLDSSGRIILAGFGNSAFFITRLDPDGSASPGLSFSESINSNIRSVVALPSGKILIGGWFSSPTNRLFRLNADGSRDTNFAVGTGFTHTTGAPTINAIAPDLRGRIWVGGTRFTSYNGSTANGIAVLQGESPALYFTSQPGSATRDLGGTATFTAAASGNNGFTFLWKKNGTPLTDSARISGSTTASLTLTNLLTTDAAAYSVTVTSPSDTLTSSTAQLTVLATPELLSVPADLTRDIGASAIFRATARGAGTLSYRWLRGSTELTDGSASGVTIAGATTPTLTVSGLTFAEAGQYRLRVTNTLGTATSSAARLTVERRPGVLASVQPGSPNNNVLAMLRLADGSMLVGGSFTNFIINGASVPRSRLARFLADGSIDPNFAPVFNSTVTSLAQDAAGHIFVGGNFTTITIGGSGNSRVRVARFTSGLVLDSTFDTSVGPNTQVNALAPAEDGGVYIGGSFSFMGTTTGLNRVARLNATGGLDSGFATPAAVSSNVNSLLRRADGKLYVGGFFGTLLLAPDGVLDTAFNSTVTLVYSLLLRPDGNLLIGAGSSILAVVNPNTGAPIADYSANHSFNVYSLALDPNGKILSGSDSIIKRTNPATGLDDPGFFSVNGSIYAIAVDSTGRIWIGGNFSNYNGESLPRLAVLNGGEFESNSGGAASPFATYLTNAGVPAGMDGPYDDPDKDGISNLLEYALGLSPVLSDPNGLPTVAQNAGELTLTYLPLRADVLYAVETTTDLGSTAPWTTAGVDQGTPATDGSVTATAPVGSIARFLRLRVILQP